MLYKDRGHLPSPSRTGVTSDATRIMHLLLRTKETELFCKECSWLFLNRQMEPYDWCTDGCFCTKVTQLWRDQHALCFFQTEEVVHSAKYNSRVKVKTTFVHLPELWILTKILPPSIRGAVRLWFIPPGLSQATNFPLFRVRILNGNILIYQVYLTVIWRPPIA